MQEKQGNKHPFSSGVWFGFFTLWHINLCGLSNAKDVLVEEQKWFYFAHNLGEDKRIHTFLKSISLKVNFLAQLEFEIANFEAAGQLFSHYTTRTLSL